MIASEQNKVNFSAPKVTFVFTQGITEKLAGDLFSLNFCNNMSQLYHLMHRHHDCTPDFAQTSLYFFSRICMY